MVDADLSIGACRLWVLQDGWLTDDGGSVFGRVPKAIWSSLVSSRDNQIELPVFGYLIESGQELILVDSGYGTKDELDPQLKRPDGDLLVSLARAGFDPEQVTIVLNTHLHTDHAGGNTRRHNGSILPTFPQATYVIQEREWASARSPHPLHADLYHGPDFEPLQASGNLRLLNGDSQLTDAVGCRLYPGHTPGHQIVVISSAGERGAIVGDLATLRWQLADPLWTCPYDLLPAINVDSKRRVLEWLDAGGSPMVAFGHDQPLFWPIPTDSDHLT